MEDSLPRRLGRQLRASPVDELPVRNPTTSVDIDLFSLQPSLALPEVAADPEEEHHGESEVGLEEAFSVTDAVDAEREESGVELRDNKISKAQDDSMGERISIPEQ